MKTYKFRTHYFKTLFLIVSIVGLAFNIWLAIFIVDDEKASKFEIIKMFCFFGFLVFLPTLILLFFGLDMAVEITLEDKMLRYEKRGLFQKRSINIKYEDITALRMTKVDWLVVSSREMKDIYIPKYLTTELSDFEENVGSILVSKQKDPYKRNVMLAKIIISRRMGNSSYLDSDYGENLIYDLVK